MSDGPGVFGSKKNTLRAEDKLRVTATKNGEKIEFYLGKKNVTPVELVSSKYPVQDSRGIAVRTDRISTKAGRTEYSMDSRNNFDFFLNIDEKTVGRLTKDLWTANKRGRGEKNAIKPKYDVGADVLFARRDIVTDHLTITLTESPTFAILSLPNAVSVKGDGDYEKIQRMNSIYSSNRDKPRLMIDNVSQTVDNLMERKDVDCQTTTTSTNAVGNQVNDFSIIDESDAGVRPRQLATAEIPDDGRAKNNQEVESENRNDVRVDNSVMFLERVLAQNGLNSSRADSDRTPSITGAALTYRLTLALQKSMDLGLSVRCAHWNETDRRLVAVAYSKLLYRDYSKRPTAVALWSMKNPYTPERFYKFDETSITCLKFSFEVPNHLAIGFYDGELLIVDVSYSDLQVVFQKSKQSSLDTNDGVLDLFWTPMYENDFDSTVQHECLVTCSFSGHIALYRHVGGSFVAKTILKLSNDSDLLARDQAAKTSSDAKKNTKSACSATKFIGLNSSTYAVGTRDGLVYMCSYDNPVAHSTRLNAHFGFIRSLEKSLHSQDIFLTTGCDCSIKIWVGDVFIEPVMTLRTDQQIDRAIWCRTNSTVIVSAIGNHLQVWDINVSTNDPVSTHEMRRSGQNVTCTSLEFTLDGKRLCVSDVSGRVDVYDWSSVSPAEQPRGPEDLMYCVARRLYGREYLAKMLSKARPEYRDVFEDFCSKKQQSYFT